MIIDAHVLGTSIPILMLVHHLGIEYHSLMIMGPIQTIDLTMMNFTHMLLLQVTLTAICNSGMEFQTAHD